MSEIIAIDRMGTEMRSDVSPLKDQYDDYIDVFKSLTLRNDKVGNTLTFNFDSDKQIIEVISKLVDLFLNEGA